MQPSAPIAVIEFHDAKLAAIHLHDDARAVIEFSHLAGYYPANGTTFDVYSHRARLEIESVDRLAIDGTLRPEFILDAAFTDSSGSIIDPVVMTSRTPVAAIRMTLGTGTAIDIRCSAARIVLELGEKFETWAGP
jgi:hypothetical protein